ncbi:uncharacterized protein LOC133873299 [Alnus glutinosa]|uniref:uncharacterized protein LOC133873299 n=1 Tax=Alnus glutinosa TaxID=3517 RepID=UPI002D784F1F|nr:uncharacterized protein LOC133873299 [Alnus glutinosa]
MVATPIDRSEADDFITAEIIAIVIVTCFHAPPKNFAHSTTCCYDDQTTLTVTPSDRYVIDRPRSANFTAIRASTRDHTFNHQYSNPSSYNYPEPTSSLEDTLKAFIQTSNQNIQELQKVAMSNSQNLQELKQFTHQAIAKMEGQIGQLANQVGERERGKLPSQPIPNPKGQFVIGSTSDPSHEQEHVQAITTLRSGRQVDNQVVMPEEVTEAARDEENHDKPEKILDQTLSFQRLGESPEINIPFLDAIQQVPSYAKFLMDLVTIKRRTNVPKKAFLTEQVSSILQCKIPIKYKDPGYPTIACMIGGTKVKRALLDLGASVNLLSYSVYVQLGLGELKPTSMTLQLADRSVKVPRGIIEDVLIKVDKFYYPVDFIVLDTELVLNVEIQIQVILGCPFLATANALINYRTGVMKLSFGNMTVELNIFDISRQPFDYEGPEVHAQ